MNGTKSDDGTRKKNIKSIEQQNNDFAFKPIIISKAKESKRKKTARKITQKKKRSGREIEKKYAEIVCSHISF